MFTLNINTDNAAFGETPGTAAAEVAVILRSLAAQLADAVKVRHKGRKLVSVEGTCRDANGNTVGGWSLTVDGTSEVGK